MLSEREPKAWSMRALPRSTRSFGFVVLMVVGIHLGYGVSPLMASQCVCAHAPEVLCDCPHHVRLDGSHSPPCHIHAKSHRAADPGSRQPCVRAQCGSIPPELVLVALVSTFERPELATRPTLQHLEYPSPLRPPEIFIFPAKHPPKATA